MRNTQVDYTTSKKLLRNVFSRLRKLGYLARQNFLCCQNCAGAELTNQAEELFEDGTTIKGVVYYHQQDAERINEFGEVYLAYGQAESSEKGPIGSSSLKVGEQVIKVLEEFGLKYEWNGSADTRILVKL